MGKIVPLQRSAAVKWLLQIHNLQTFLRKKVLRVTLITFPRGKGFEGWNSGTRPGHDKPGAIVSLSKFNRGEKD